MSAIMRFLQGGEKRALWPWQLGVGMNDSVTGRAVTPESAIASTAVWASVRVISESLATLPLNVYERLDRGRELRRGHPLYPILHDAPNPKQTAVEFREQQLAALLLWGNAYALIERWPSGRVRWLWPMRPDRVTVRTDVTDEKAPLPGLVYQYQSAFATTVNYPATEVLHVRGLSSDGLVGLSPIQVHRQAVEVEQAEREFAGRFFGNNARPGGILKTQGRLSADAATRLKASWENTHRGLDNAHRVAILEEGLDWVPMSMPLNDAQFIEQRRFSLEEIARIFRVPLHMVGDLSRATFSNIEHQSIEFVTHTIRPWAVRLEQSINSNLFFPSEIGTFYAEHSLDALLRGDVASRYAAYAIGRQWGWLSSNDVRERENLNPIDGGDVYLSPMNMVDQSAGAVPASDLAVAMRSQVIELRGAISVPDWMRGNARRGLAWHEKGLSGDGVTDQTLREARAMIAGTVSEDKARRMSAWFARHMGDLDAPSASPDSPDYPSPGVVAHALWGGGNRAQSERAERWAQNRVAELDNQSGMMRSQLPHPEPRETIPPGLDGDVIAILRLAYDELGVPQMAQAIREALGDDHDGIVEG